MLDYRPIAVIQRPELMAGRPIPAAKSLGDPVPPPTIDPVFTSFTGIPGVIEGTLVLVALGASAYLGVTTGLNKKSDSVQKTVGWVAGVGSGLIGLLYLGTQIGLNDLIGLPAVRISPV